MALRILVILVLGLSAVASGADQLPVYVPKRLEPIPWPLNSPDPGSHGNDRSAALTTMAGRRIAIVRAAMTWGTGVVDEWYFVGAVGPGVESDSVLYGRAHVDSLWSGRSFYNEAEDAATGDSTKYHFTVAGCLFIADDSLLAYGVIADTILEARAFMSRERGAELEGYYRLVDGGKRLTRVGRLARSFHSLCEARLNREARGLDR